MHCKGKRKVTYLILTIFAIFFIACSASGCSDSSIKGTYKYSSTSYIDVTSDSQLSFVQVYVGKAYYQDGTYVGSAYMDGTATYTYKSTSKNKKYKITATFTSKTGSKLVVTAYYYDYSTPYITFNGVTYTKS